MLHKRHTPQSGGGKAHTLDPAIRFPTEIKHPVFDINVEEALVGVARRLIRPLSTGAAGLTR